MNAARVDLRAAVPDDAAGCREIYAPFVRDTAVSFETSVPTVAEMGSRIAAASASHAWWVAAVDDDVVGYAYASAHRARPAYRWACDVSVYLAPGARGQGLGRALYSALFTRLVERGYVTALAGVALPNDASLGLHRALGFEVVGTYRHIGFKLGRWHDVCWLQRSLVDVPRVPLELEWRAGLGSREPSGNAAGSDSRELRMGVPDLRGWCGGPDQPAISAREPLAVHLSVVTSRGGESRMTTSRQTASGADGRRTQGGLVQATTPAGRERPSALLSETDHPPNQIPKNHQSKVADSRPNR